MKPTTTNAGDLDMNQKPSGESVPTHVSNPALWQRAMAAVAKRRLTRVAFLQRDLWLAHSVAESLMDELENAGLVSEKDPQWLRRVFVKRYTIDGVDAFWRCESRDYPAFISAYDHKDFSALRDLGIPLSTPIPVESVHKVSKPRVQRPPLLSGRATSVIHMNFVIYRHDVSGEL
jgi:hypothetical protein